MTPEARWIQPIAGRTIAAQAVERMVHTALPRSRVLEIEQFPEGLRNSNFKIGLDSPPHRIVLRVYQHDVSLCQKELDLTGLVGGVVAVPEVIHAQPGGLDELPPFLLRRYVEGITFMELRRGSDTEAIAQAAHSAGETLAAIGRFTFPKPGWLGPGPTSGTPLLEGSDPIPRFMDLCMESPNLHQRVPPDLRDRTHELAWSHAPQLAALAAESTLVHGDYNKRNVLVREEAGRWSVAAVLDWEFAVAGAALADVANFVRYERAERPRAEPHFSTGYLEAGGKLPTNWRYLAKVLDLTALCESLTREDLPDSVTIELVELLRATIERRDPRFS
ncbi:MAG TPA: phosphotransferase [Bryobacteraceae bacterium]|nr:phosphotransferase [Bryobacteraceae bacterium]